MPYTHVDCFSGPGGFCTGLHAAGFETKVAIEYIKSCVDIQQIIQRYMLFIQIFER